MRLKLQAAFLCAYDGMVDSDDPVWLQTAFDTLAGLFGWVGLKVIVKKTMGVVFHICQAVGVWAYEAYTWQMTWVGRD